MIQAVPSNGLSGMRFEMKLKDFEERRTMAEKAEAKSVAEIIAFCPQ